MRTRKALKREAAELHVENGLLTEYNESLRADVASLNLQRAELVATVTVLSEELESWVGAAERQEIAASPPAPQSPARGRGGPVRT